MKTRNNPNNIQESILDTLDLIKETPVNSFFKQRVLKQLLQEKDLKESQERITTKTTMNIQMKGIFGI